MLKLPKIVEEVHPLMQQYKQIVLSKANLGRGKQKTKSSKFDWISCEFTMIEGIHNEALIKELIKFQTACKDKKIAQFYSYFFLKSLLLNKDLKQIQKQGEGTLNTAQLYPLNYAQALAYVLEQIQKQTASIEKSVSIYQKIQNYIDMRQDLLRQIQQVSKQQSHNFIHENVNDIRFLNLQILQLIRAWKVQHQKMQKKTFAIQNIVPADQLQFIEPIFIFEDQNYLSKMVYDNANVISAVNLKKQVNFISPPNPFFLTQDGNKQSMSQSQKDRFQAAMQFFARQKAYELRLLLQVPQFMAKRITPKDRVRSSSVKNLNAKEKSIKKVYGSINKDYMTQKSPFKKINEDQLPQNRSLMNKKILTPLKDQPQITPSAYVTRASRLRQQVQKSSENRAKFENLIKLSQLDMLKQMKKKKSQNMKQLLTKAKAQHKPVDLQLSQSPYKDKISKLRKQVEKNVESAKLKYQQVSPVFEKSIASMNRTQTFATNSLAQIRAPKPKIKLIIQRQVVVQNVVVNPILNLFAKKSDQKSQAQSSKEKSVKQEMRRSFSTFYKSPQQQRQKSIKLKESKISSSKPKLTPVTTSVHKNKKESEVNDKQIDKKLYNTASNFLYKPKKLSKKLQSILNPKKNTVNQDNEHHSVAKIEKRKSTPQVLNSNEIDDQLRSLKGRVRQMQIMKVYGKKSSSQRRRMSQSNLNIPKNQEVQGLGRLANSPYRKENMKSQRSLLMKKEAVMLQEKIQRLLKQQQIKGKIQGKQLQIREQDETIYNETNSMLIGKKQLNAYLQQQQINDEAALNRSILNDELQKLSKKQQLIEQSNQLKQKEIESNKKAKQKYQQQIQEKNERMKKLQARIEELKKNRRQNSRQEQDKMKESIVLEMKQVTVDHEIKKLKEDELKMKMNHQTLKQEMKKQQEKFIKLKQEQYKLRQQMNRKKYLESLQQIKSKQLQKQRQYQQRILQQQRMRKQHQIQLIKQRRQAQEMKMKLHYQQMKELLLVEILEKQKRKQQSIQKQAGQYELEMRKKIQMQIRQKQEYQRKLADTLQQENQKMMLLMNEIRERNRKLEQANKKRLQQVDCILREKREQQQKLQLLEKQFGSIQQSRIMLKEQQEVQSALNKSNEFSLEGFNLSILNQKNLIQEESQDWQELKLKLKHEILNEMIERRKREENQEMEFEEERKKRLKKLQDEIKEMLKKQDEMIRDFDQEKVEMTQNKLKPDVPHHPQKIIEQPTHLPPPIFEKKQIGPEYQKKQEKPEKLQQKKQEKKEKVLEVKPQPPVSNETLKKPETEPKNPTSQKSVQNIEKPQNDAKSQQFTKALLSASKDTTKVTNENTVSFNESFMLKQAENDKAALAKVKEVFKLQADKKTQLQDKNNPTKKQAQLKVEETKKEETIEKPNLHPENQKNVEVPQKQTKKEQPVKQLVKQPVIETKKITQTPSKEQKPKKVEEIQPQNNITVQPQIQQSAVIQNSKPLTSHLQQKRQKQKPQQKSQQKSPVIQKKTQESQVPNQTSHKQTPPPVKMQEPQTTKITLKQSNQEIAQKWQSLKPSLNEKTKFMIIEQSQISSFIDKFYSSFPQQVKEMLPYSKVQLQAIVRNHKALNKKIDIFNCNSVGWYDPETKKYTLIGSIECLHLIAKKYGQIQTEMVYIFNKSNHYQKQFLVKQVKIFEKIGYVYQKKLKNDDSLFSIKLITKVPKEAVGKGYTLPDETLKINASLVVKKSKAMINQSEQSDIQKHNNVFWHLLGDCLKHNLSKQQMQAYTTSNLNQSIDMSLFLQSIKPQQSKKNNIFLASSDEDNVSQISFQFKLPYIQLRSQQFYSLQAKSYTLNTGQTIYVTNGLKEEGSNNNIFKLIIMQCEDQVLQKSYLETFMSSKIQQLSDLAHQRQLNLLIPVFKLSSQLSLTQDQEFKQNFTFKSKTKFDPFSSSISYTKSLANEDRKIIVLSKNHPNHGFIFCIAYGNQKIEKIVTGNWVSYKDIVK